MAVTDFNKRALLGNDAAEPDLGGQEAGSAPLLQVVHELRARINELEFRMYQVEDKTTRKGEVDE